MISLSKRLGAVASLVRGGGILADIGTDHGYLPVYLVQKGIIKGGIAADIGKKPLENAAKSVKEYELSHKIELRLSDGLSAFSPDEVQEVVFAGMGGTLISEKLKETPWIKNKQLHFVFQPQSRAEELREYLYSNGFEILNEVAVSEGRRFYIAFDVVFTGKCENAPLYKCFLGELKPDFESKEHIKRQLSRLEKRYNANVADENEKKILGEAIEKLKEFISYEG